ncbi:MAG: EAL domain-containing protein [Kineosporiaceae bacterium]|jgi:EAL domain-containing protein (putative c-di-GMP-specific phosphodiesterase class I)/GGDEF domain-containing protein/integral membrane sensor domain MASE1
MAAIITARSRAAGARRPVLLGLTFAVVCIVGYLLVLPRAGTVTSLWFPPAGLTFGYLVAVGHRGLPVALLAAVGGGLLVAPDEYRTELATTLTVDVATTLWYTAAAVALRRVARVEASFTTLAAFLVLGVAVAPGGAALVTLAIAVLSGDTTTTASWATSVVGEATAVVTLAPAFLLLAATVSTGRSIVLRVPRRRRLEMVAQSSAIVLMPALFVFADGVRPSELLLAPLALAPVAALAVQRDLTRAALVLAGCAVVLGAAAQARFGVTEPLFRLQVLMFAGAVATCFTGVALTREDGDRRSAEIDSTRWRAMAEVAPAVVARVDAAGRWRFDDRPAGLLDTGAIDVINQAETLPALVHAVAAGVPATVQWVADGETGRRFLTHVTPLPDGERLAVTTETTALHSAELTIAWERSHDRETDLPNRELLVGTADQVAAIGAASVVVVDLDRAVRRAVLLDAEPARVVLVLAERVRRLMDPDALAQGRALVARLGDDQLGVLVPDGVTHARMLGERIVRVLRQPVPVPGGRLALAAWAGVAAVDTVRGARDCLDRAAAALEVESDHGQGHVSVLDALTVSTSTERARLVGDVVEAVGRGELEVVFQPDVDLVDGRLTGVEALVRWRRREGFTAATDLFVRLAEEAGAVQGIDAWVMEESLRAMGRWRAEHHADGLELGLNVSAFSLTDDLPERLFDACMRHGVPPEVVRLEVTETALVDDSNAPAVLRRVRQRGCRVALDDFGTGYATLSRLHRLPVDVLKLDRSFLTPITEEVASQALVSLVLGLAGPLRVEVLVEGVETRAQRDLLVDLGCRRAQGYLFARPSPAATIDALLARGGVLAPDAAGVSG